MPPKPPRPPAGRVSDPAVGRRLVLSGFLFGCGVAGSVIDLFIFHLVLQWHHFYDLSTPTVGLVADGLFHGATWLITVWGLFMFADVRQQIAIPWSRWTAAVLAGVGFFQLIDGVVFHKVLRIHQVRYGVDLFLYDLVWIGSAITVLVIGLVMLYRTRNVALQPPAVQRSQVRRPRG